MLEQVKENEVYQRMPSGAKKGKKPNTVAVVTALAAPVEERDVYKRRILEWRCP